MQRKSSRNHNYSTRSCDRFDIKANVFFFEKNSIISDNIKAIECMHHSLAEYFVVHAREIINESAIQRNELKGIEPNRLFPIQIKEISLFQAYKSQRFGTKMNT